MLERPPLQSRASSGPTEVSASPSLIRRVIFIGLGFRVLPRLGFVFRVYRVSDLGLDFKISGLGFRGFMGFYRAIRVLSRIFEL